MTQAEIAADYRRQLEPHIADQQRLDRAVAILMLSPEQRTDAQVALVRVLNGLIYHASKPA